MSRSDLRTRFLHGRRILVLKGGWSAEREVSLRTGTAVEKALRDSGAQVASFDLTRRNVPRLVQALAGKSGVVVFNALHGEFGEDGQVQGLLELLGVPYTGSGVLASALAMDKPLSRRILEQAGIPVPPWQPITGRGDDFAAANRLGYPVVVKPAAQGSAVGVSIVHRPADLAGAARRARRYGPEIVLERYLRGMEVTVGILGSRTLPVIEIVSRTEFYDYEAKYAPGMSEHIIPARLPSRLRTRAAELALRAHRALGCRAVSRVDLVVSHGRSGWGPPSVLEVNTLPGLTATSLLPDAARAAGIAFPDLVLDIIRLSLR